MGDLCESWAEGDNQGPETIEEDSEESGDEVQEISAGDVMAYCEICDNDYPAEDLDHFLSCGLNDDKIVEEVEIHNKETFEDLDYEPEAVLETSRERDSDNSIVLDETVDKGESKTRAKERASFKWPSDLTEEVKDELEEIISDGLTITVNDDEELKDHLQSYSRPPWREPGT